MVIKKKAAKKKVVKPTIAKKRVGKVFKTVGLVCKACVRMNAIAKFDSNGNCLTCKRMNRKQDVVEVK